MSKRAINGDKIRIFGALYVVKKAFTIPGNWTEPFYQELLKGKYIEPVNG